MFWKAAGRQNQSLGKSVPSDSLIDLRTLVKRYETPAGPFTALRDVDLKIGAAQFVAIVGKSGSGKSTLLNMITGIDRPSEGEVIIGGTPVHTLTEAQMASWRGRELGIVFQFFQLLPTLTVKQNIILPMEFANLYSPREREERALALLERVGLADQADKMPSALSGGQQQRVAIARALANDPSILVADEPTGNLDTRTANAMLDLFAALTAEGKTIVMVTHDNDLSQRADRTFIVADGQVYEEEQAIAPVAEMFDAWAAIPALEEASR
jgi:putative ABC transport system ATP-binding protein